MDADQIRFWLCLAYALSLQTVLTQNRWLRNRAMTDRSFRWISHVLLYVPLIIGWFSPLLPGYFFSASTDPVLSESLYLGLEAQQSLGIARRLDELGHPYKLAADSSAVLVSAGQCRSLRLQLAAKGLPEAAGMAIGNNLPHLEKRELEKTLSLIDGVRDVRIQIVPPSTGEDSPMLATVVLDLPDGAALDPKWLPALTHTLQTSVEGVDKTNIFVVNQEYQRLPGAASATNLPSFLNSSAWIERDLEDKVGHILERYLAADQFEVDIKTQPPNTDQPTPATRPRLSMILAIARDTLRYDHQTGKYLPGERASDDFSQLARLAAAALSLDTSKGDQFAFYPLSFDFSQKIAHAELLEIQNSAKFWTDVAIHAAKALGLIAAVVTLRFILAALV